MLVRLRAFLERVLRGKLEPLLRSTGAPTQVFSLPHTYTGELITERHARAVIDLCLRVGVAMLGTGASSGDVVAMLLRISSTYRVTNIHIDVTFTSITISVDRGVNDSSISAMRVVRVRTIDYTRLQNMYRLIDEVTDANGPPEVTLVRERLAEILTAPHPYRRWVVTSGKAILAAGVVVMFNVSVVLVLVAAVTAVISDVLTRRLTTWAIPAFFVQMAAAAATTAIAVFTFWLDSVGVELPGSNYPTVIVISGIVMLLSGIGVTASARDALDGYYVTASARGLEVIMLTLGLAVGISVILTLSFRVGLPVPVGTSLGEHIDLIPGVIGAALIGVGFALTSYVRPRLVLLIAIVAALVFAVYWILLPVLPQPGLAHGVAGAAAGVIAYLFYRWLKVPETVLIMAGIIGLIPGLAVYRGLYLLMDSEYGVVAALPALVLALSVGLGLAAGSTIGTLIARRVFGLDRAALLAARRPRTNREPSRKKRGVG